MPNRRKNGKPGGKVYRVWEANRKIFLYPENWIEPELRDDQTPFFREATSALLQNELTPETVEDAFRGYLEKLDEVARLEIVGMVRQKEDEDGEQQAIDVLHVFGRTYTQPHKYFHRTLEKGEWSPWLKIETDIDSDHMVPVIFNRRLCLFWLFFTQEAEEAKEIDPSNKVPKTKFYWKIQIAWSEFQKNKWSGKKLSKSCIQSAETDRKSQLAKFKTGLFLRHYQENRLFLHLTPGDEILEGATTRKSYFFVKGDGKVCEASFVFENTASEPKVKLDVLPPQHSLLPPVSANFKDQLLQGKSISKPLSLQYEAISPLGKVFTTIAPVFGSTPHPRYSLAVEAGAAQPLQGAFVFQDSMHSFWVEASKNTAPTDVSQGSPLKPDSPDTFALEMSVQHFWGQAVRPSAMAIVKRDDAGFPGLESDFEDQDDDPQLPLVESPNDSQDGPKCLLRYPRQALMSEAGNSMELKMIQVYAPSQDSGRRSRFQFLFSTFYHPHVKNFVRALNKSGVPGVLLRRLQEAEDLISFQTYQPTPAVIGNPPIGIVDFTYGAPYAQYNWELFFHLPIHIACRLSADQRFEEARKWFHYVFDPTTGESGGKERFWQFKPFYDEAGAQIETLAELLENQAELEEQVEKWAANPFQPHVVARMRISAYMKFTVMKYVDNLVAWGDQLFRRDTIESINEATNLYILASKILGPAPQKVPSRTQRSDKNFNEIKDDLDPFSNGLVEIEGYLSPSAAVNEPSGMGTASALGSMFYFGVPRNEYLLKYWDTVADRLFKIRHSLNIEGVFRSLPLFEPPIDPALLVRAAASGMDLNSLLDDLAAPPSQYRFAFMLQKANELANEVKGLGASLLSALEKRDAEALSLLRSGHEQHLLNAVLQVRERQVEEAKEMLAGTQKSLEAAKLRFGYYSSRKNTNRYEADALKNTENANFKTEEQGMLNTFSSVLSGIPELKVGAPTTVGSEFGGMHFSAIYNGLSSAAGTAAGIFSAKANLNSTLGSYERRMDDWKFQADQAKTDIEQLEKQVLASEIRLAISERELSNHQLQMEQSAETDEFMRSKFTNRQLFDWMSGQVSSLYFQTYQMAYDLAKQVEQCFQLELPHDAPATGYVNFGYWDNLKKGLLAGEKLQFDLRRLEMAHLEQNKREFEITKHVSLRQINPVAILTLRETGKCAFNLPEVLFDMDFPGHYKRRIKSVSISIPCIAGPYTGLNATLRLTKNEYRRKANLIDPLVANNTPSTAIAVSTGQNDSGLFELNFRDERYLPFEGAGAISEWNLELPEFRQFDYNTISDVVMHIRYTALEEAGDFKTDVSRGVTDFIGDATITAGLFAIIDLQHDLPTEWHKAIQNTNSQGQHILTIPDLQQFLPFYAMTYVRDQKFQIADTQFFHTSEITEISLIETISLKNKEVKFKSTDLPDEPIQKAFLVIRFTLE
jgi:hypothetical protein